MVWIKISADGKTFSTSAGEKFTPLGFNYDRDYKMRLLEEYWDSEWQTVAEDFREMKNLGANVVRIHLQFSKFMDAANEPNEKSLAQLKKLLALAEEVGIYLDLTGLGSYRKADVPAWYDKASENERWSAQANFWEAIAKTCASSPAIFCYNLINEPIVPQGKRNDWLVGELAGFWYVEAISLDPAGRKRSDVAREWISKMANAIRKHDQRHLITVGFLPNSADEPSGSGFVPKEVASELDFISVHLYPTRGKLDDDLQTLKKFSVGKPLVVEEIFPMHCSADELREFIKKSQGIASGWIGFYWGQTAEELRDASGLGEKLLAEWLKVFVELAATAK